MHLQSVFPPFLASAMLSLPRYSVCHGFSSQATTTSSPILTASEEDPASLVQFDTACVANPVIVLPHQRCPEWQCYYYGNNGGWNNGYKSFLPTGSTGLAVSDDGIKWTRVPGSECDGAVLAPSKSGWDCVHIGANDVLRVGEELHMYYFGGSDEEVSMGPMSVVGLRMRIGRAKSNDNGRTWKKDENYILDYDESEGFFASWPRVVQFKDGNPWKMTYHSFNGKKWRVYGAESTDCGDSWYRTGLLLEGEDSEDAFDFKGIGTRSVVPHEDGLLMVYEGVCSKDVHRLGAAFKDLKTKKWTKMHGGLPILEPGKAPLGDWASGVIGTPYVVEMPDGSMRLYHCGKKMGIEEKMAIGVVQSKNGDIKAGAWSAIS